MVKIRCINKSEGYHENPNEAISHYGWINESSGESGRTDRLTMVDWVRKGNQAYVVNGSGQKVYCYIKKSVHGTEFLQTQADGVDTNNLLELPECSA